MNTNETTQFAKWLAACAATALVAGAALTTHAQTWQTVDDFQPTLGFRTYGSDIGTDSSGQVLYSVGGISLDANDVNRLALVNVSYDHGTTWTTLQEAANPDWTWQHFRAFASAGNRLFIGGNGTLGGLIRESVDGGVTWTTSASFDAGISDIAIQPGTGSVYAGGSSGTVGGVIFKRDGGPTQPFTTVYETGPGDIGSAWGIGFHPNGSVIAPGNKVDSVTRAWSWLVVRSATGDAGTWQVVDTFKTNEWTGISAGGVLVTDDGTIYISGWAYNSKTRKNHWIVRASTDVGNTWTISDNFSYGGSGVQVYEMTQDKKGSIYVCGQASDKFGKWFWIVRKWGQVTTVVKGKPVTNWAWTTSDAYQFASGKEALALGITVDVSGSVFTCGRAQDATGVEHLIVRKLTP